MWETYCANQIATGGAMQHLATPTAAANAPAALAAGHATGAAAGAAAGLASLSIAAQQQQQLPPPPPASLQQLLQQSPGSLQQLQWQPQPQPQQRPATARPRSRDPRVAPQQPPQPQQRRHNAAALPMARAGSSAEAAAAAAAAAAARPSTPERRSADRDLQRQPRLAAPEEPATLMSPAGAAAATTLFNLQVPMHVNSLPEHHWSVFPSLLVERPNLLPHGSDLLHCLHVALHVQLQ